MKHCFIHQINNKIVDILFSIVVHLPEQLVPQSIDKWLNEYADKRLAELQQEIVRQKWQKIYLLQSIDQIRQQESQNQ